jgi:hypothetical protein
LQLNEFSSDVKVSPLDELQRAKGIDRTNKQLSTEIAAMDEIGESILQAILICFGVTFIENLKKYISKNDSTASISIKEVSLDEFLVLVKGESMILF